MDIFIKNYKRIFKEAFTEYGFKNYRNTFYWVKNDVLQLFSLHKITGYCTIEFSICPLCMGVSKSYLVDFRSHPLYFLEPDYRAGNSFDPWHSSGSLPVYESDYDPRDERSILNAIIKMMTDTKKFVIPFFQKTEDCASAYQEICNIEKKVYSEVAMNCMLKFYFKVKTGDYKRAVEHLKAIETQNLDAMRENLPYFTDEQEKVEYRERVNEDLKEIRELIRIFSNPDTAYINRLVAKNEEDSLINLGYLKKKQLGEKSVGD